MKRDSVRLFRATLQKSYLCNLYTRYRMWRNTLSMSAHEGHAKPSLLQKIVGGLLFAVGAVLFFTLFPFVLLIISIFDGLLVSIPCLFLMPFGYCLFTGRKFKTIVPTLIGIMLLMLLPSIVLLSLVYQILSICVLVLAFISALYWYRSRHIKSKLKPSNYENAPS